MLAVISIIFQGKHGGQRSSIIQPSSKSNTTKHWSCSSHHLTLTSCTSFDHNTHLDYPSEDQHGWNPILPYALHGLPPAPHCVPSERWRASRDLYEASSRLGLMIHDPSKTLEYVGWYEGPSNGDSYRWEGFWRVIAQAYAVTPSKRLGATCHTS